jgi:hypothetical protein
MLGLSKGEKAFKNCGLKTLDYTMGLNSNNHPMAERNNVSVACPGKADGLRSQPGVINGGEYFTTRGSALRNLATFAGKTACKNCPFAVMTPPQLDIYRGEVAAAQAIRIDGETDLMAAQARREAVERQIAAQLEQPQITPSEQS